MLINCTDETFQKWEITPLANQAPLINSIEGELQRAEVFLAKYRLDIRKTIGKDFTEQTFQAARMAAATNAAKGLGANTNFVPNNAASQVFAQPQVAPALPTMQQPVAQATTQPTPVAVAQPVIPQVTVEPTPVVEVKVEEPKKETKKATKAEPAAPVADVTPVAQAASSETTEVSSAEEIDWSAYIPQ